LDGNALRWRLIRALIGLPATEVVLVPAIILWATHGTNLAADPTSPNEAWFWLALVPLVAGLCLLSWTVALFLRSGKGTPLRWDPPKTLVIRGPYRHVRNPMATGDILILIGESLLMRSWPLLAWVLLFFVVHSIYFPLVEEKHLEERFGDDYLFYKANVPRWLPKRRG